MAEAGPRGLSHLPHEVLLHVISYLELPAIASLQLVSRSFKNIVRDNNFWKSRCLEGSSFLENLRHGRRLQREDRPWQEQSEDASEHDEVHPMLRQQCERTRIMANWDPSFPGEDPCFYGEYIQRFAPTAINWFQQPCVRRNAVTIPIEARGMALYYPENSLSRGETSLETALAVSPLDDAGICLWDVNGTRGRRGNVVCRSKPGILFVDGPGALNTWRSRRVDSGVAECVSIDSQRHRAFFAVQTHLMEVDLQRLSLVNCTSFPRSITTLSKADASIPLTVGTTLGIHLHDHRVRYHKGNDPVDTLDDSGTTMCAKALYERDLKALFDKKPLPPMTSLSQPGPLSILHLPRAGSEAEASDDIFVAGRFSNILHYDRRKLDSIKSSIFSGARLCSLTSWVHPYSTLDSELRRKGELSKEQVDKSKGGGGEGGRTLIACGEYGSKGSLELYGLSCTAPPDGPGGLQNSTFKNRHTAAPSKLLSVVNHGTRIAVSDGTGHIAWFERDGFTEVRRCKIGNEQMPQAVSVFSPHPCPDDMARKLLPTRSAPSSSGGVNDDDLLFWTGEKLGLVTFSKQPWMPAYDCDEGSQTAEERELAAQERAYSERIRRALERQADDVRLVRNPW